MCDDVFLPSYTALIYSFIYLSSLYKQYIKCLTKVSAPLTFHILQSPNYQVFTW